MTETTRDLSPEALASRALRDETMRAIRAYVRARLFAETTTRGVSARISEMTGITTSAIAQVRHGKSEPGEAFCRDMATYWGLTYAELEDAARTGFVAPSAAEASTSTPAA